MPFSSTAGNFYEVDSRQSTIEFLAALSFGGMWNGSYDGDAMMADKVSAQRPDYNINTAVRAKKESSFVRNPANNADVAVDEPSAVEIDIPMNQSLKVRPYQLWSDDEEINVIRNYRERTGVVANNKLAIAVEDNQLAYMNSLATATSYPSSDLTANGKAGTVLRLDRGSATEGQILRATGKPKPISNSVEKPLALVANALKDLRTVLKRAEINLMGGTGVGGSYSQQMVMMPPELYDNILLPYMETKFVQGGGTTLLDIVQQGRVFGAPYESNLYGFQIYSTNRIKVPTGTGKWYMWVCSSTAIAAPMRPVRNVIQTPENLGAPRYQFNKWVNFGRQLINSRLIYKVEFDTVDS